MQWLTLLFAIQAGTISGQHWTNEIWQYPAGASEISMDATFIAFDHFELEGLLRSYQVFHTSQYCFVPFEADYGIGIAFVAGPLKIGARHECDHSIRLDGCWSPLGDLGFGSSTTELYIRFEHKFSCH
jgi:hypothetical protein